MRFLRITSWFLFSAWILISCKPGQKSVKTSTPTAKENPNPDLTRKFMDACREKIKGNLEVAVNGFNECLHIDPNNAAAHYELACIYNQQERNDLALGHAKAAASGDPQNEWYHLIYAQILQETHNPAEAASEFTKLIKISPLKLEYYYGYSDALLYEGKYKEAIKVYEEIEQKMGPSDEVILQKAKVLDRVGETAKAEEEIRKLIRQNPLESKYYAALAQLFQDRANAAKEKGNKIKQSEAEEKVHEVFIELLKNDPYNSFAQLNLAEYYENKGQADSAFIKYKQALENPDLDIESKIKVLLRYYYESASDTKLKSACETLCYIVTKLHPQETKGHAVYADFLYRDKRLPEARREYRLAIDADKSKYVLWNQLLIVDSELNDYSDMSTDSKEAIELFPSMPLPYLFNGLALIQEKKYSDGIDALNSGLIYVLDNKPLEGQFHSTLGDAYYKIKENNKSDQEYDKALELDPDNSYVLNNFSYYLSLRNENLDKAEKMSKRANELDPKNANFQDTYAWVLYKTGKYPQALEWMDKVFASNADPSAVMLEHYGDILFKLNRKEEAFAYWMKAKLKGGGSELLEKKIADRNLYE
jgi:tetratricopeptide (TPR) repeat protein